MERLVLFVEALLLFALGIAGNKIAETFSISPAALVIVTSALVSGTVLLSWRKISIAKSDAGAHEVRNPALVSLTAGVIAGLVCGTTVAYFVDPKRTPLRVQLLANWETQALGFDIAGAFAGFLLCLVVSLGWGQRRALSFSIGYALAMSTSFLVVHPSTTGVFGTFGGHLVTIILAWCIITPLSKYLTQR